MANIRFEVGTLTLDGYRIENQSFASNGSLARLTQDTGSLSTTLSPSFSAGLYNIVVAYFDESDGQSTVEFSVNGTLIEDWKFDQNLGGSRASSSNRVVRTLARTVSLEPGSTFELTGMIQTGELARIDYIELVPVAGNLPDGPTNRAPVANNDTLTTTAGTAAVIDVLSNDRDADNDTLAIADFETDTGNGTVRQNADGTLTYQPNEGFSGSDRFSYSLSDGQGGSDTATVNVTVNAPPPPSDDDSRTPVRIEAEQLQLAGSYSTERANFASNRQLIYLQGGGSGTATTQFMGAAGDYTLNVVYHDEKDGESRLVVRVTDGTRDFSNADIVDDFTFSEATRGTRANKGNRRTRSISNVSLVSGSQIQLEGFVDDGEVARIDYIELVPVASNPPNGGGNPPVSGAGVILNLETGVGLAPVFGALEAPRLMPLGDSITAGQHSRGAVPGGYRIQFWDRAVQDGLSLDFIGGESNGPASLGDRNHEGDPGRSVSGTTSWVNNNLTANAADAILLMIGTNDGGSGSQIRDRLSTLVDAITTAAPDTYLFVSSTPPVDAPRASNTRAQNLADYNALIPALVSQKASDGKKVFFVDAGGSLELDDINGSTNSLSDGLHPTAAGYDKLGDAWYEGVFNPTSLAGQTDLTGTDFDDRLIGNDANNTLTGGDGQDRLTGGGGADIFRYNAVGDGLDTIVDFSGNDRIQISAAGFGGSLSAGMSLGTEFFIKGNSPAASSGNDSVFLYNTANNVLSFDRDGVGNGAAVAIATFSNGFNLRSQDFSIVA
ncbi:MAG: Ig-like domain-containing protein [Phormidesmis sp.]